jgi:hypothetical protein
MVEPGENVSPSAPITCYSIIAAVVFDLPTTVEPPTARGEKWKRRREGGCKRARERG